MINFLIHIDKQLFLFLNGKYNSFFDFVMWWISDEKIWIPLYLFLLFKLTQKYTLKSLWITIPILTLLIITSDQVSVQLFKNVFKRWRPCHDPEIQIFVHIVKNHCGGNWGFISSHATNTMALATFLSYLFCRKKYTFWLTFWVIIVCYSRIYLGVHFPSDIIGGIIIGIIIGYLYSRIFFFGIKKQNINI